MSLKSAFGSIISTMMVPYSFWVVKLDNGKLLSERDTVNDFIKDGKRPIDWTLDLITTGDIYRVKELWLICPPNPGNPTGQTARLPITIPGTAFQFKVANMDVMGAWGKTRAAHVIGRVDHPETGDCTVFAWDDELRALIAPYQTNIHEFKTWRDSIASPRHISMPVLGLDRHF